jgi:hypothetical protein
MSYRAPLADFRLLNRMFDLDGLAATDRFAHATPDVVDAVLTEAARLSETVLAPLNRAGDRHPARLENGQVVTSPGFAEGYRAIASGGWIGMAASLDAGGMGLPMLVATAVNEMMGSACLALQLNPLMSQGQIEALEHHASDELKAIYLPKLISGEWCATMNLTEPQAGSDVGALTTRAEPRGDGTYAVTGRKIFITWGDNDFSGNVCHLVLARLPGGGEGTRGISLFMVPKILPGTGQRNALRVARLEEKLGLHGSPTCEMLYEGAVGWLVGEEHRGMAAMFTMMNNARLGVGVQGLSVAEAALQQAWAWASERRQGRTPDGSPTILGHADVRRMLAEMRVQSFAARAVALACAAALDRARATGDAFWAARAAFLTPIAKAYGTDTGHAVAHLGIQVHGGMGFIEDTGAAQLARDVRVTQIYEGTNGIQAMDLVGRKFADGGLAAHALLDEIENQARSAADECSEALILATGALRSTTARLLAAGQTDRFAGAVPYLGAFARLLGAHYHARAASLDPGRAVLARLAVTRLLPEVPGLLALAEAGAEDLYALTGDLVLP